MSHTGGGRHRVMLHPTPPPPHAYPKYDTLPPHGAAGIDRDHNVVDNIVDVYGNAIPAPAAAADGRPGGGDNGGLLAYFMTTSTPRPTPTPPQMSMAVLMLIVVASLSLVVGAIYLLIYFKSIKPMSARSRSYGDPGSGQGVDDGGTRKSAGHMFFRRK